MAIPTKIKQLANDVRTKIYGRDVRESIAKGMEASGELSEESNVRSKQTSDRQNLLEERYDVQVGALTEDSEVIDARVSFDGNGVYPNLKNRLDSDYKHFKKRLEDLGANIKDYGAIGDGNSHPLSERFSTLSEAKNKYPFVTSLEQEVDWAAIQLAINENAGVRKVLVPAGIFMISDDIVLPAKNVLGRNNSFVSIIGAGFSDGWMATLIEGKHVPILKATNKDVTVLKTYPREIREPYQAGWSRDIYISDINIIGPQSVNSNWGDETQTNKHSAGLHIYGAISCIVNNVSVQGFGQGIRAVDCIVKFTGMTSLKNNYRGLEAARNSNDSDCILTFDRFESSTNVINLSVDNARSINMLRANIATAAINVEKGTPLIKIINCAELDLTINNAILESNRNADDVQPFIDIDSHGVNILTIKSSNVTSLINSVFIKTKGYFSAINLEYNIFHPSLKRKINNTGVNEYHPIVEIEIEDNTPNRNFKSMMVNTSGNDPTDIQPFIKSNFLDRDYVPEGYKQINLLPNVDKTIENVNVPLNTNLYSYSEDNVIHGDARLYYIEHDETMSKNVLDVHVADSDGRNAINDVDTLFISILSQTGNGDIVPFIYRFYDANNKAIDYFSGDTFEQRAMYAGSIIKNGVTFDKYIITVRLNRKDHSLYRAGIRSIRIGNIRGGSSAWGIEKLTVYAPTTIIKETTDFFITGNLSSRSGYWKRGMTLRNTNPTAGGYLKKVCVESGRPGTWKDVGKIEQ